MSTYDKASLVLIPSGTKEGVVFSQKPTNGDGDFTFTRASSATRVNSDGLIEKERGNVLLYSQDFTNAYWVAFNATKTTGQTDPNGGSTAVQVVSTAVVNSGLYVFDTFNFGTNKIRTASVWMKGAVGGEVVQMGDATNRVSVTLTTDWVRYEAYAIDASTYFVLYSNSTAQTWYVAFGQYEDGLVATDYIETTTTAVYGGITDNIPRLDYTDASCPSLLLEPQRTNSVANSEYLTATTSATISYNEAISPEGVNNTMKLTANSGLDNHFVSSNTFTLSSGGVVGSVFAKKGNVNWIRLRLNQSSAQVRAWYDLENGVVGQIDSGAEAQIIDYGNGWYRCIIIESANTSTSSAASLQIFIQDSDSQTSWDADGDEYIYIYGAQEENPASYVSSYIPTSGSAVTRVSEPNQLGKTDLITDGFFSSTELTWFIDVDLYEREGGTTVAPRLISSSNNQVFIGFSESLGGNLVIRHKDGTTAANTSGVSFDENGQRFKVLVKISGTTGEAFINGSSVGTFTTLAASNYDEFENVANNAYNLRQMLMFPTALTDSECIDLTTI